MYGIHVHRDGHEPLSRRFRSDDRVNLYSVAKTFTSVALGLAEADGRLTLDDPLLDHLPELRPLAADGFERVTLRHLVTMTSGTGHQWFADERIDAADRSPRATCSFVPKSSRASPACSWPKACGKAAA
ncbi:serine hydrolase domain-containing protein [Actinoplanes sp. NPDC023714]|uniref:serine hydrolase domain-containing protein n=1 Tax=Actinoplanes sp. NPDC023714 TaxID=3154322 RepID=UPI0033D82C9B